MRPKEFDRNAVLEKCIVLFWKEGYNGTGIQKIVERTMVNRYSLYDEFGNKDGILIASLHLYMDRHIPWEILNKPDSLEEILFQFYSNFFRPIKTNKHPIGCYISTMALELRETALMQDFFNSFLDILTDRFTQLIRLKSKKYDVMNVAKQLTVFYCTSMGMYIIFSQQETEKYIQDNLNLITKCLN